MTGVEIKREFVSGRAFELTNHYITREDHPCFGTRHVEVASTNTNSVKLHDRGALQSIEWPKASQLKVWDDGTIAFYGGGCGQSADELFVTFKVAA